MVGISLKVAEALQNDIGRSIARVDSKTKEKLGVSTGDFIKLNGKKSCIAIVWQAHPDDEGLEIIRIDGMLRQNAGVGLGDKVSVEKAEVREAKSVALSPMENIRYSKGFEDYIKKRLMGKPFLKGNVLPVGVFGTSLPLIVSQVLPAGAVVVGESTQITVKTEPVKELANVPNITYDEVGGL